MAYLEGNTVPQRAIRPLPTLPAYDLTAEMAKVDTLVLQALLARIEDERTGVADALHELDRKSMDLRALRAFKKVFDDYALGKEADDKVSKEDLAMKDGQPVNIEVPRNTTLIDAVRYRRLDALTDFHHGQFDSKIANLRRKARQFDHVAFFTPNSMDRYRNVFEKEIAKTIGERQDWDASQSRRRAELVAGEPAVVEIDLLTAAAHFNISLGVAKIADVQKITEQINNLISEESTEAQKLSTVANDKYQQLTQLVRELSNMTRMRHEGRLSTVNRI